MTPILLLVGNSGSGKDTVANLLSKNLKIMKVANADPLKRFAKLLFDFSEEQLWGSQDSKNAPDTRYNFKENWIKSIGLFEQKEPLWKWIIEVTSRIQSNQEASYFSSMRSWFDGLYQSTHEQNSLTPRKVLQTLGTEWGRKISPDIWINNTEYSAFKLLEGGWTYSRSGGLQPAEEPGFDFIIITDGRFRNEILKIKRVGGIIWKITRPEKDGLINGGVQNHATEQAQKEIPDHFFDSIIDNGGDLRLLDKIVNAELQLTMLQETR